MTSMICARLSVGFNAGSRSMPATSSAIEASLTESRSQRE
jgi:hypothetical protein